MTPSQLANFNLNALAYCRLSFIGNLGLKYLGLVLDMMAMSLN